jgi:hypothetical protein
MKMAKEIILYNLAKHVTDEEYKEYAVKEKGPLIESLPSVKKFQLFKITKSVKGEIPYKYVGVVDLTSLDDFMQKDAQSKKYQDFRTKWQTMVSNFEILFGEEVY